MPLVKIKIDEEGIEKEIPDEIIFNTFIRCQGRFPENKDEVIKHFENCKWCHTEIKIFIDAEERGLYISK